MPSFSDLRRRLPSPLHSTVTVYIHLTVTRIEKTDRYRTTLRRRQNHSRSRFTESQVRFSECGGACSAFLLLIGLVAWWLVGERGVVWSWGSWFPGVRQHQCFSALSEVLSYSPVVAARGVSLVVDPSVRFSVFPGGSALVPELVWVA
ncbi:hypothetical protein Bca4012_008297 [Brassica carinata]